MTAPVGAIRHPLNPNAYYVGDEDGTVDKWETYQDGHLTSVSFDAEHAGRPTNRLIYTADGNATAEHVDATGHWIAQK